MTSALRRRAFVLGGKITPFIGKGNPNFISKGHPEFGKKENPTLDWYISEVNRSDRWKLFVFQFVVRFVKIPISFVFCFRFEKNVENFQTFPQ